MKVEESDEQEGNSKETALIAQVIKTMINQDEARLKAISDMDLCYICGKPGHKKKVIQYQVVYAQSTNCWPAWFEVKKTINGQVFMHTRYKEHVIRRVREGSVPPPLTKYQRPSIQRKSVHNRNSTNVDLNATHGTKEDTHYCRTKCSSVCAM